MTIKIMHALDPTKDLLIGSKNIKRLVVENDIEEDVVLRLGLLQCLT